MLSPGVAFSLNISKHGALVTEGVSLSALDFIEGAGTQGAGSGLLTAAVLR